LGVSFSAFVCPVVTSHLSLTCLAVALAKEDHYSPFPMWEGLAACAKLYAALAPRLVEALKS
jgi:hypothetical protein